MCDPAREREKYNALLSNVANLATSLHFSFYCMDLTRGLCLCNVFQHCYVFPSLARTMLSFRNSNVSADSFLLLVLRGAFQLNSEARVLSSTRLPDAQRKVARNFHLKSHWRVRKLAVDDNKMRSIGNTAGCPPL